MADQGPPAFRDADWSVSDELLVATEHLGFVRNLLSQQIKAETANAPLGLTRLLLSSKKAVRVLDESVAKTKGAPAARSALAQGDSGAGAVVGVASGSADDRISMIARDIRALAMAQHGGWIPTLGRNRLLSFPGSVTLGATREIVFGSTRAAVGASREIVFGAPAGSVRPAREIVFGGGSVPAAVQSWSPAPRPTGPGRGVRVGLLDTGIWPHPWLAGGWVARPSDIVHGGAEVNPVVGHGTFVAGLILSQAPGATVEVRRVLDEHGHGTAWEVAEAIVALGRSGVDVLNLSFACYTADGQPPLALARAVDRVGPDVIVVAAAGNHALNGKQAQRRASAEAAAFSRLVSWPAALDDVIAVGAVDDGGHPAGFSPNRPWVDVAAPGTGLRSTYLPTTGPAVNPMRYGDGWAEWNGTSFAAGLVSGAIAAGTDAGRVSAPTAAADLLSTAKAIPTKARSGKVVPPRLDVRRGALG